jgi:hypothetical protein
MVRPEEWTGTAGGFAQSLEADLKPHKSPPSTSSFIPAPTSLQEKCHRKCHNDATVLDNLATLRTRSIAQDNRSPNINSIAGAPPLG